MRSKRLLVLLTFVFAVIFQQSVVAHAEDDNLLKLDVVTDKQQYEKNDEITYTITIENTYDSTVKNVVVTSTLADGLEVTSENTPVEGNKITWNIESIESANEVQLRFTAVLTEENEGTVPVETEIENETAEPGAGSDKEGSESGDADVPKTESSPSTAPKTGDTTNLFGYILVLLVSALVLFVAVRALVKRKVTKELTLLLALAILAPSFTVAKAEEHKEDVGNSNTHSVTIDDAEYQVTTVVEAELDSGDPVPSEVEIPVTGVVLGDDDTVLANQLVTFTSSSDEVQTVETDDEGYFVIRLKQGETYKVASEGVQAVLAPVEQNNIELTTTQGQIILGKTLTNGENQSVLQPSTIYLDEEEVEQVAMVADDFSKVTFNGQISLQPGDVFLLSEIDGYPTGGSFKVTAVSVQGNQTVVSTVEPKLDEVFSRIKGSTNVELSPAYFIPAPGFTVEENQNQTFDVQPRTFSTMAAPMALDFGTSINLGNFFPANSPVKFNGVLEVRGEVSGDIDWAAEWDLVDSWDFNFKGSQLFKGELVGEVSTEDRVSKRLGEYRIPTNIPGLAVSLPIDAIVTFDGSLGVEVVTGMRQEIGIQYTDRDGVRVYPEDKVQPEFTVSDLTGAGGVSLGVKLSILAEAALVDVVGIAGEGGIAGNAKLSLAGPSGFFKCAQIDTSFYSEFSLEAPIADWEYDLVRNTLSLGQKDFGSCVRSIKANPTSLEMAPGESKILLVDARDGLNNSSDVGGDEDISYRSSNSSIVTVDKDPINNNANVRVAENAQDGDTVTIYVTFKAQGKEFKEEVTVKVVDTRERGTLVGRVVDAVDSSSLDGASVKIYNGTRVVSDIETSEDGTYETSLVPGTYKIVVSYPNYITDTSNVTVNAANTTTYDSRLQMVGDEYSGIGTVSGKITNALTAEPVPGLTLEIRKGRNTLSGEVLKTVTTNDQGGYEVELPGGNYTIAISGEGYIATSTNIVAVGGMTRGNQNTTISPDGVLGDGVRIVLNWGETPRDLDSHLTGPTDDGGRFHVYFGDKVYKDTLNDANLDVDDVTSYGPETVTVLKRVNNGTYTYAIHNYTDRYNNNLNLSNSEAVVRVYSGDNLLATYNVPINKQGNVWRVFEIRDGAIVPINRIDQTNSWRNASDFAPE